MLKFPQHETGDANPVAKDNYGYDTRNLYLIGEAVDDHRRKTSRGAMNECNFFSGREECESHMRLGSCGTVMNNSLTRPKQAMSLIL